MSYAATPSCPGRLSLRDSYWQSHCEPIGEDVQACYGPGWEVQTPCTLDRYDFYEVSVERRGTDGAWQVLFDRRFAATDVHANLLTGEPRDVMRFDRPNRRVIFAIGRQPIEYRLDP